MKQFTEADLKQFAQKVYNEGFESGKDACWHPQGFDVRDDEARDSLIDEMIKEV